MSNNILIRKIDMECALCAKNHQVEERKRITKAIIKNEEVDFEEIYYLCDNCENDENEFIPAKIMDSNLLCARNAYRKKMGLLTSSDIVGIRNKYGLTQMEMANLLGWGEATISRYESKAIQDDTYDSILRLVNENPMETLKFYKRNKMKFSSLRMLEIKEKIIENLNEYGKEYLRRQELESEYVCYQDPSDYNGNQTLNIDKVESIVTYFAINISTLYKVKLMKLLWYADALNFKLYDKSMTGLVYAHMPMGALPVGHYKLLGLELINSQEEYDDNGKSSYKILPSNRIDFSILSKEELEVLSSVVKKFKAFSGQQLAEYMHREIAYQQTNEKQVIPFSLTKQLLDF